MQMAGDWARDTPKNDLLQPRIAACRREQKESIVSRGNSHANEPVEQSNGKSPPASISNQPQTLECIIYQEALHALQVNPYQDLFVLSQLYKSVSSFEEGVHQAIPKKIRHHLDLSNSEEKSLVCHILLHAAAVPIERFYHLHINE